MDIYEPYGYIYITTNTINGKKYIGQTRFTRKKNHEDYLGSGKIITKAIKKYGKENFVKDIVYIAYSEEELNELEKQFIFNHNACKSDNYYNVAEGGGYGYSTYGYSDEEREEYLKKLSDAKKGKPSKRKGIPHTEEAKKNISDAVKKSYKNGNIVWNKGIPQSESAKKKNRDSHLGKVVENVCSKVICLNTLEVFYSINEAQRKYGGSSISACCRHIRKSSGKLEDGTRLAWMYYDEYLQCVDNNELDVIEKILNDAIGKRVVWNKGRTKK